MELLQYLTPLNLQLPAKQVLCVVNRLAQHVTYRQEMRFVLIDDAAVGRYADLAVGKCIESIYRLVR